MQCLKDPSINHACAIRITVSIHAKISVSCSLPYLWILIYADSRTDITKGHRFPMLFSSSVCLKSVRIVQNRFHFSTTPYPLPDMLLAKHILTGKR